MIPRSNKRFYRKYSSAKKKEKTNLVVLDNHSDEREREITKNNISRMECCGALGKPLLGMPTCNEFLLAFLLPHSLGPD